MTVKVRIVVVDLVDGVLTYCRRVDGMDGLDFGGIVLGLSR